MRFAFLVLQSFLSVCDHAGSAGGRGKHPRRACSSCPSLYPLQLWYAYLKERRLAVRGMRPDSATMEALNNTYERALVSMHKMPRIWLDYLEHLVEQRYLTRTRRTFDRALASLPITQHDRIWQLYMVGLGAHAPGS